MIVLFCFMAGAIVWLVLFILLQSDRLENAKNQKSFYENLYHEYYSKYDEVNNILENIKSSMPF